jgi:hypothetical protein
MSALRRLALGFPLEWEHRRGYAFDALAQPGAGPYFIEWDPGSGVYGEDWTASARDAAGVLLTGTAKVYHPIRIAQFALHRHGRWLAAGDDAARVEFLAQARWLRDRQQRGGIPGLYRFGFPWKKYAAPRGWSSAMAQGEAISVLLRAEGLQPGAGFGSAALRAAEPFRYDLAEGGVVWRSGTDVFFEEIANRYAPHVLNGCVFALWGLWELAERGGDAQHRRLAEACAITLRRWVPAYDTGWWTLYSLLRSAARRPHIATLKYHAFHVAQMRVLAEMFDERVFAAAADRWSSYVENRACRSRLFAATVRSLPERLLGRDTVAGGARV